jgi:peptidoglycan/LPS O-acetylase OafA/YrhL
LSSARARTPRAEVTGSSRLRGLDGLRGLAIAAVVCFHAFGTPREGQLGVDLFFVLSGFLITTLLTDEWRTTHRISLRAFYGRRARRLLPALAVMLVAVTPALVAYDGLVRTLGWAAASVGFSANLVVAFAGSFAAPLTPLWSLAQEEQFYLVWPLLLVLLASRRRVLIALLAAGVVATTWRQIELMHNGAPAARILYSPETRSVGILVGSLTALILGTRLAGPAGRVARVLCWPALGLVIAIPFAERARDVFLGGLLVFAIACALAIVHALETESAFARVLGFRPLAALGRISYSLYLWNLPIILIFGQRTGLADELAGVVVAVAIATLSYRYVEQPFLRRRSRRLAATEQPAPTRAGFDPALAASPTS